MTVYRVLFANLIMQNIKGIILAGGTGTRLYPCTKVINKHLLPVYDKPMIFYPIETLKNSGIRDILIISNLTSLDSFMKLLGSGQDQGLNFTYKIQDGASGTGQALSLARDFAEKHSVAVILGDNIFIDNFSDNIFNFQKGAQIFIKKVTDPSRFGVAELRKDKTIRSLEEKPIIPKSNYAITGFYLFDKQIFSLLDKIKPSQRGELELTDVLELYLQKKQIKANIVQNLWGDAGTHDSLLSTSLLIQRKINGFRETDELFSLQEKESNYVFKKEIPKVTIGLITYNSFKYIQPCLRSLLSQDYKNIEIIILDNNSTDQSVEEIKTFFPQIKILFQDKNRGFGAGQNKIIQESTGEFYLCANIDVFFEENFISELVKELRNKPNYGSIGGKLKLWNFELVSPITKNNKEHSQTNFIDSVGIKIWSNHKFEDIGQGTVDCGQFDKATDVFGVTGAAVLFRRKALEDIAFINEFNKSEFFDESMFLYKEDIDIAYRLQWAGWKSCYIHTAIAYHDRSVRSGKNKLFDILRNRDKKSGMVKKMSYLNHHILLKKNFSPHFSWAIKHQTFLYNTKIFFYLLFFETGTLWQWNKLWKMKKRIETQRRSMPIRISQQEMEKLIEVKSI